MDSSLSRENGVVKSRSLLGHFHRLRFASGSQKAHKPGYSPGSRVCLRRSDGIFNKNNNKITNRYE